MGNSVHTDGLAALPEAKLTRLHAPKDTYVKITSGLGQGEAVYFDARKRAADEAKAGN
jgi:hypothetical protein